MQQILLALNAASIICSRKSLNSIYFLLFFFLQKEEGIADVKWVIEQERSAVLRGCTLVLSGLVPLYQDGVVSPEPVAPAAKIAAKLGAKLAQDLTSETTHLVAANRCTAKVHQAKKMPHIKVVNPHWLAACAHRLYLFIYLPIFFSHQLQRLLAREMFCLEIYKISHE